MRLREAGRTLLAAVGATLPADPVLAHSGSLAGSLTSTSVPFWLVALSGGGLVGASFLFTSFATDHEFIAWLNDRRLGLPPAASLSELAVAGLRLGSVATLGLLLVVAFVAPADPRRNLAIVGVWAVWWAGYTASVYLLGNSWPALNPWRAISGVLPRVSDRDLPAWAKGWPPTAGLLVMVWLEVVTPVAAEPVLLAAVVLAYSVVTLAGAAVFGTAWYESVDPISRVFGVYGRLAPVRRTEDGFTVELPGSRLVHDADGATWADVLFVVALVWATSFDGLVSTPAFAGTVRWLADLGVPALAVYVVAVVLGYALFLGVYRLAALVGRRTAGSYVSAGTVERRFVGSLVPIAAGYHLAHFLGYFVTFVPAVEVLALDPFSPPQNVPVAELPAWFSSVGLAFVVLGHLLAIWVAHSIAFETFTGRLQPIRSQYPFALVMVFYTMTSMWLLGQPYVSPPV
ncbi:hypothetical protein [Haloarchaeobius iranensis]|uniref:Uncharacterized protein n=1 Tax=Haloarchaeobius iranensis TaxID=996166 RepID=A0A1G9W2W5_9EURY|nr:hypothetical protein [Haloarchaeobius iranensis]SDM78830.1 hypothetical protein SAMN05192554_107126 [Haloarchaeobius iranensis]